MVEPTARNPDPKSPMVNRVLTLPNLFWLMATAKDVSPGFIKKMSNSTRDTADPDDTLAKQSGETDYDDVPNR
jgi:hypothetical protein